MKRIAVIPGDGIGIDVTRESMRVLQRINNVFSAGLEFVEFDWGAEKYLKEGIALPARAFEMFRKDFDAILFGAVGDPRVPDQRHAAEILLALRFGLDLYANVRPVRLFHERLCPLKGVGVEDVNFAVIRENTEGAYVNSGGVFKKGTPDEVANQVEIHTRKGVDRIVEYAFQYAERHGKTKVCMSDKSNVMGYAGDLWQRCFKEAASRHAGIQTSHLYIDALCLLMVRQPQDFEVIVTNNMFGDIVTDLAAALQGGLGIAASANINPGNVSLFEPVHGSSPPLAGKNIANPMGSILTAAMMLEYLGLNEAAQAVENAVVACVNQGQTTRDVGGSLGTREVADAVLKKI
ncbi:MAG TPA: isocitrate/isopropylmalate dehydrogenase family protein [Terriglobia bacterium]|nr:isocitrate/isopropylmalate dehydrogenase family protein [Terriglobia bacterium]